MSSGGVLEVVSIVAKIGEVAAKIKGAVDTADNNKELCRETAERATRYRNILVYRNIPESPLMRDTLIAFKRKFDEAHKLVKDCQNTNIVLGYLNANDLRDQLRQVNIDLTILMQEVFFLATPVEANSVNLQLQEESTMADSSVRKILSQSYPTDKEKTTWDKIFEFFGREDMMNNSMIGCYCTTEMEVASISLSYKNFNLSEMEEATNNFSENNIIRRGRHATVYKGELSDKRVVAIKRFDYPATEATILPFPLQHENVVDRVGYCHEGNQVMVVEEYMPNGTFSEIINALSKKQDWNSMLKIIQGVAEGVAYLHINRVIHLDLKPDNIVLDEDMNPKICDFEKSKILHRNDSKIVMKELVGTLGYIAPEYIAENTISLESDVFSFGVILLHTINRLNMAELDKHPIVWAWEVREAQSVNELERFIEIGLLCAQEVPEDRPAMSQVIKMLNGDENLSTPKKPGFVNAINMRSDHTDCATTEVGTSSP